MKVAIYARVSTVEQKKEGVSLEEQIIKLRKYCSIKEWDIYKEYVDGGFSGRNIKRPAYKQMLEDINNWDILLVSKLDRTHRNLLNSLKMLEYLNQKNKQFASINESIDTTSPYGRTFFQMVQSFAELESNIISNRVKNSMSFIAENGKGLLGFPAPFGYEYNNDRELIIKPSEAKTVKDMFHFRHNKKMTYTAIADTLNAKSILTRENNQWTRKSIARIISNPIYTGYIKWDGHIYKNEHDPIIDIVIFKRLNRGMLE